MHGWVLRLLLEGLFGCRRGRLEAGVRTSSIEPASISSCVTGFGRSGAACTTARRLRRRRRRRAPAGRRSCAGAVGVGDQLRRHVLELQRGDRAAQLAAPSRRARRCRRPAALRATSVARRPRGNRRSGRRRRPASSVCRRSRSLQAVSRWSCSSAAAVNGNGGRHRPGSRGNRSGSSQAPVLVQLVAFRPMRGGMKQARGATLLSHARHAPHARMCGRSRPGSCQLTRLRCRLGAAQPCSVGRTDPPCSAHRQRAATAPAGTAPGRLRARPPAHGGPPGARRSRGGRAAGRNRSRISRGARRGLGRGAVRLQPARFLRADRARDPEGERHLSCRSSWCPARSARTPRWRRCATAPATIC